MGIQPTPSMAPTRPLPEEEEEDENTKYGKILWETKKGSKVRSTDAARERERERGLKKLESSSKKNKEMATGQKLSTVEVKRRRSERTGPGTGGWGVH